jgi:cobalamin transport system substrate-binding protein
VNALRRSLAVLAIATGWVASAHAAITVADFRGGALTLAAPPQRIVSLLPSLTESVCALGACSRLVGTDRFSNAPAEVKKLPKLGGIEDPQVERIVMLRPDVVLVAPSSRVIGRLERLGLKVLVIESNTYGEVRRSLGTLAQLLGVPERGAAAWAAIERELASAAERVPPAVRGKSVYFEIDGFPYAAGSVSFLGETLARLGLRNIAGPDLGPFPRLTPEFIVRAQPDLVMAQKRFYDEMPRRPGWMSVRAVRERQGCAFSNERYELLIRPGPRLGEAAQVLADCLVELERKP